MITTTEAYGLTLSVPAGDTVVGASLREHGEYARVEVDFLLATAAGAAGVFVDVGANLGAITTPFAAARPDWEVLAIEPHRGLNGLLAGNVAANRLSNVRVLRAAVGDASRVVDFPDPSLTAVGNFGDIALGYTQYSQRAHTDMVALDDVAPPGTRLLKVDVQGFEPQVLQGAPRLLKHQQAVWVVEASSDPSIAAQVVEAFARADYRVFWFYSPFVRPEPNRGVSLQPFVGDANFVAVPPGMEPAWELTPVAGPDERRPGTVAAYPYLAKYGYR